MDNIFLSEAINDYPFPGADLNGCINDQLGFLDIIKPFDVIEEHYQNEQCQHDVMLNRLHKFADIMKSGSFTWHYSAHGTYGEDPLNKEPDGLREGLYPFDGNILWDYELINAFSLFRPEVDIFIILDSCFSGGMSRLINPLTRSRFYRTTDRFKQFKGRNTGEKINGVLLSGSGEHQTSADAYIHGKYYGALSYFMITTFVDGMTKRNWYDTASPKLIKAGQFDQRPELLGTGNPDTGLFGRPVIEVKKNKGCIFKFLPI